MTAALKSSDSAPPAPRSRAAQVQKVVSKGGIEAWLVEDYTVPLVAVEFAFKGGASQDPEGKAGAANLLSGLLDEGAGPYDAEGFHRALDEDAVELSFSADRDNFHGHLQTLARNAARAFDLLRLAVNEATLADEPFGRVSAQIAAGLRRELNEPDQVAARAFRERAYAGHRYGLPVRGDLDVLPALARADLADLRGKIFSKDRLKIAVVGAIDAPTLAARLDETFGPLPGASLIAEIPRALFSGAGERIVVDVDVPQSTILFGRQGLARDDPDFFAALVVNHVLGGGVFSARLFHEVREKRGLAYSVYSQLLPYDRGAMFYGGTSTKNERAAESMAVIEGEVRSLAGHGPTAEELEKAKKYLIGSYALRFDSSTKIAVQLLALQADGFGVEHLDERNRMIAAVTMEDARRAAARLFDDSSLLVVAAGRPDGM